MAMTDDLEIIGLKEILPPDSGQTVSGWLSFIVAATELIADTRVKYTPEMGVHKNDFQMPTACNHWDYDGRDRQSEVEAGRITVRAILKIQKMPRPKPYF